MSFKTLHVSNKLEWFENIYFSKTALKVAVKKFEVKFPIQVLLILL